MTSSADMRDDGLFQGIRRRIQARLLESPAYRVLPVETQHAVAHDTVKAIAYIVGGADGQSRPSSVQLSGDSPIVRELADAPPLPEGDTAGARFAQSGAVAAQQGTDALADIVSSVNFPTFVSGLIDGVFNAIVTSSIKQMEAYAELVANVAKSVDQYMKDNVTENNARDYLVDRYPHALDLDFTDAGPRLKAREGLAEDAMPDFQFDLGLPEPISSLDGATAEEQLVPAARRRIAMDRQQLLATMVMMGVNRLVVTNGLIEASCLFEVNTRDEVRRRMQQKRTSDWTSSYEEKGKGFGYKRSSSGFLGLGGDSEGSWFTKNTVSKQTSAFNVTTTRSEDSTARVDLHAKLAGKVNLSFKSDYFPMEKMVDALQINQIRGKTPTGKEAPGAASKESAQSPPAAARA